MYTTVTVQQLLDRKGRQVWSLGPRATVMQALELMQEKNVGALLVMQAHQPVGIFSERDYARKVALAGKTEQETLLEDVMTRPVIAVRLNYTIPQCLALMSGKFIRHLPVVSGDEVVGILSIGDIVKEVIGEQEFLIEQLVNYIAGETQKPPLPEA